MKRRASAVLALVVLSGCSKTTEQICAETDQLLKEKRGSGFRDTAYIGCLKLSAKEAQQSLIGLKELLGKDPVTRSRKEIEDLVARSTPESLIHEFGQPTIAFRHMNTEAMDVESLEYGRSFTNPSKRDPVLLARIFDHLAKRENADYYLRWDKPLSRDMFGAADDHFDVTFSIKGNTIVSKYVGFPDYFWERWID